jgi:hypothetical protein
MRGNDVCNDPWPLETNWGLLGYKVRFVAPRESVGPVFRATDFESFDFPEMPHMFWLFDNSSPCSESVSVEGPSSETTYLLTSDEISNIPYSLDDADIVALGAPNSWPGALGFTAIGPIVQFQYTETVTSRATFSFANGTHRLVVVLNIQGSGRSHFKHVKLTVTGSFPNRIGVFSVVDGPPSIQTVEPGYDIDYVASWSSVTRDNIFYKLGGYPLTETMSLSSTVWSSRPIDVYSDFYVRYPLFEFPDFSATSVTLPTFSNITWGRA